MASKRSREQMARNRMLLFEFCGFEVEWLSGTQPVIKRELATGGVVVFKPVANLPMAMSGVVDPIRATATFEKDGVRTTVPIIRGSINIDSIAAIRRTLNIGSADGPVPMSPLVNPEVVAHIQQMRLD